MRTILAGLVLAVASFSALAAAPETLTIEEFECRFPPPGQQGCPDECIEDMDQGVCVPKSQERDRIAVWIWQANGYAEAIDGDTIELKPANLAFCPPPNLCPAEFYKPVRHIEIELFGIDAPELDQICQLPDGTSWACGVAAKQYLQALIALNKVSCVGVNPRTKDADLYGRPIAGCHTRTISSLNAEMVRLGYALADNRYPDVQAPAQRIAERDRAGIWSGRFMTPWEWRERRKLKDLRDRIDRAFEQEERGRI